MKTRFLHSEGMGSSFNYTKNVLERALKKLMEMRIVQVEVKESIWVSDITSTIRSEDIMECFEAMEDLPKFLIDILNS